MRAGYDSAQRREGSKVHLASNPPGHMSALHVPAANKHPRAQVSQLAEVAPEATGEQVRVAYVD